jgi:hypothetical protein
MSLSLERRLTVRYNPVLGEFFRCTYNYPDGSEGLYIAEQVSHHPVGLMYLLDPGKSLIASLSLPSSTSLPPMVYLSLVNSSLNPSSWETAQRLSWKEKTGFAC